MTDILTKKVKSQKYCYSIMVTTSSTKITFPEYLNYEDGTDNLYELADGELLLVNPPAKRHFKISRFLVKLFEEEISRQGLDIEVFRGIGVRTGLTSSRIPDVSVVEGEVWRNLPDNVSAVIQVPLLLAVEIVSPGAEQILRDYTEKVREYQEIGISEYWIVDPMAQKITIMTLDQGSYNQTVYQSDELLLSNLFPQLKVTARAIFSI